MPQLKINDALQKLMDAHLPELSKVEDIEQATLAQGIENGSIVMLANPQHPNITPVLIGQPTSIKVNANIGTSPFLNDVGVEMEKLAVSVNAGAHTVMDLSTAGDLNEIRQQMLDTCPIPLGTVPIYSVAQKYIEKQIDPCKMDPRELLDEIAHQAKQGVDFMTLHMGVTQRGAQLASREEHEGGRLMGIVSRGGAILARWMRENNAENPLLTHLDEVMDICREYNVTLSLGDGLRPGAGQDAGDGAQWEEVIVLGEVTLKARAAGVQAMIEGPGHVPFHQVQAQIQGIKNLTHGAPLYVLGPLVTDAAPGYDHISGAVGGTMAALFGADFLCYLTPAEHLTLPDANDVYQGVMASRIAAHAAEVAMGRKNAVARDRDISIARKELDWEAMANLALDPEMVKHRRQQHKHEKECAMCGKFCAIRMLEETI